MMLKTRTATNVLFVPLMLLLASMVSAADHQCETNFYDADEELAKEKMGDRYSPKGLVFGKTYSTKREYINLNKSVAFDKLLPLVVNDGWKIDLSNKRLGLILTSGRKSRDVSNENDISVAMLSVAMLTVGESGLRIIVTMTDENGIEMSRKQASNYMCVLLEAAN